VSYVPNGTLAQRRGWGRRYEPDRVHHSIGPRGVAGRPRGGRPSQTAAGRWRSGTPPPPPSPPGSRPSRPTGARAHGCLVQWEDCGRWPGWLLGIWTIPTILLSALLCRTLEFGRLSTSPSTTTREGHCLIWQCPGSVLCRCRCPAVDPSFPPCVRTAARLVVNIARSAGGGGGRGEQGGTRRGGRGRQEGIMRSAFPPHFIAFSSILSAYFFPIWADRITSPPPWEREGGGQKGEGRGPRDSRSGR